MSNALGVRRLARFARFARFEGFAGFAGFERFVGVRKVRGVARFSPVLGGAIGSLPAPMVHVCAALDS
jgi:hypothetical protein